MTNRLRIGIAVVAAVTTLTVGIATPASASALPPYETYIDDVTAATHKASTGISRSLAHLTALVRQTAD
ncbi:hypothetical protein [Umezawaea sp. Da 62-37]|uniref:hypothetical protein n=1 Tax=Umezawaea sp. Da 62-37 TaxID=3075927 RepID=UPI0028F74D21|nr:hypothetical protein [Umezawaea sp. Da 62-37]WNV87733.1 hypothetical protein RM788_05450 [Umezawaea sp. Da 62-37]